MVIFDGRALKLDSMTVSHCHGMFTHVCFIIRKQKGDAEESLAGNIGQKKVSAETAGKWGSVELHYQRVQLLLLGEER